MLIYLFVFLLSLILLYLALKSKYKIIRLILLAVSLFIPCLLAGLRDLSIGTDTSGYMINVFNRVGMTSSFHDFYNLSMIVGDVTDPGYLFIEYISKMWFNDFRVLLFITEVLIIVPIFISLYICNKNRPYNIIFGMFLFFMFMYNVSLNMARQSISLSMVILGIALLDKKHYKSSVLFLILGFLFHKTTLIALPIYLIHYYLDKKTRASNIIMLFIYVLTTFLVFNYKNIILMLYNYKIYEHGILYLSNHQSINFGLTDTVVYIVFLLMVLVNKKSIENNNINYRFYLFMAIEGLITLQLGIFIDYIERVSLYFIYPLLIIPLSNVSIVNKKVSLSTFAFAVFMFLYYVYAFGLLNLHETIPFVFGKY